MGRGHDRQALHLKENIVRFAMTPTQTLTAVTLAGRWLLAVPLENCEPQDHASLPGSEKGLS